MARRGSPIPRSERLFVDKPPDEYPKPDVNPYLKQHFSYGRPVLTADQAAACRGAWSDEFGREAPLHVEIGPGNGFFFSGMASRFPERNWLGVEIRFKRVMLTAKKLRTAGAEEFARVCRYDASAISDLFVPGEIAALYINHPDPWPKDRQAKNRLLGPRFLEVCASVLEAGAEIRLKTDHVVNVEALSSAVSTHPQFELVGTCDDVSGLGAPWGEDLRTNYQRKFDEKGEPVLAVWVRRV
ncbi:MAG TPA: hypothetical protein QGF58_30600 [Myxococcota bacterium]|nr:hypothetical protein [Myxococcota bacterium]